MDRDAYIKNASTIISALLSGKGVKHLLDILCDTLENPVILCAPTAQWFLYASKYRISAPDIQEMLKNGDIPDAYWEAHHDLTAPSLNENSTPFLLDQGLFSASRRIVAGIYISGKLVAVLTAIEENRQFQDKDYDIMEFICAVLVDEFQHRGTPQSALYEYQLQSLLRGELLPEKQAANWLSSLGWRHNDTMRLCVILTGEHQRYSLEASFRIRYADNQAVKITRINNYIALLLNCSSLACADEFFRDLNIWLTEQKCLGIITQLFTEISCLADQFKLCCDTLSSGLFASQKNCLLWHEDITPYHLLFRAAQSQKLEWFISSKAQKLIDYDKQYGTEYWRTLKVYFMCGNKADAIQELCIHRNTLNYRLEKISEIIDIDYENGRERFSLQLSAYAEECLAALRKTEQQL